jgi:glycosyltransferase involved in cell wall biosynthesis
MRICQVADLTSWQRIDFTNFLAHSAGVNFLAIYFQVSDRVRSAIDHPYTELRSPRLFKPKGYITGSTIREVKNFQPDLVVVESYTIPAVQILTWWLTRKRIPWVSWVERPGMRSGILTDRLRSILLWQTVTRSSGIFATGSLAQQAYQKLVRNQVTVLNVPYSTEIGRFLGIERPNIRRQRDVRFLYVGQLIHRKGVDILLEAFKQVLAIDSATLVIVGDGPEKNNLSHFARTQIGDEVSFVGYVDWAELHHYYGTCDVFCFPSRHDGWGLAVYEAMASGMPVVATEAVGAVHDLVENGANGFIVPAEDPESLAEAMLEFVLHPEKIVPRGMAARLEMRDYTLEAGTRRFLGAAEEVLSLCV